MARVSTQGAGAEPQRGPEGRSAATTSPASSTSSAVAEILTRWTRTTPTHQKQEKSAFERADAHGEKDLFRLPTGAAEHPKTSQPADGDRLGLVKKGISGEYAESKGNWGPSVVKGGINHTWRRRARVDALLGPWRRNLEDRFTAKMREANRAGDRTGARWYEGRAEALATGWSVRARQCGRRCKLERTCLACGEVREEPLLCGLRNWCSSCVADRAQREHARLVPALLEHTKLERARWFARGGERSRAPQLRLMTLTVREQGTTLEAARELIAKSWPKLRRWLRSELGYAPPFCGTWELGYDPITGSGVGHPHLHVCIIMPWVDVRELASAWVRATRDGAGAQGLDLKTVSTNAAARYVSAYITGATLDDRIPAEVAAAWVRTTYGRRLVMTSRHFWMPEAERVRCECGCMTAPNVQVRPLDPPSAAMGPIRGPPRHTIRPQSSDHVS